MSESPRKVRYDFHSPVTPPNPGYCINRGQTPFTVQPLLMAEHLTTATDSPVELERQRS